ncbi:MULTISPECIES: 2'-5' RNA ligase family protein [unclassified Staphylococcus]|uniref:2'-5' RNA ligase family protein n=1 Tax=unclassified Staphylococcus TaxID=91994 RepID=UPI0021D1FD26|nr:MULTISPECIES: 2'-5' RNA ligase family protein [unclassified Staphylococcus]UXR70132.1 2'-5' RNA ligase family protein [Staphylococcus sp. IVB6246]UXR72192.1 2'-5' RNA ligase family protein [Staphylococcus sp. IVB6240]UXR74500.1 2'-5' RNA ligase family protein [Staphylococcus sp. IVB6238]UXR76884.1 2'-5' RNA ligase family protein [Staphylococcus sp. IVB6233]UXR81011.1 2'-5' RNA ligase family protein [Staphylococcus sp. IVB6218]
MILGLALIPSKSFRDEVNAYRKRYDKEYIKIQPHITVKSRFEVNDSELEEVKAEISKRLEGAQPAEIHATKASNFAPTTNVIYFKVEKTDVLEDLFNRFDGDAFYGEAEHPFVPHFTIAQGLTSQEFEDIYGQVRLAGVDHKETIDQLSLLQFDEEADKWQVIETYELG